MGAAVAQRPGTGRDGGARRRRGLLVASVVALVAIAIVVPLTVTGRSRVVLSDLLGIPVGLAAATSAWCVVRQAGDRATRRAWTLLAAAVSAFVAGDVVWAWLEVVRDSAPFPSSADAGYLAFYPLALVGLLALPVRALRRGERWSRWFDAATVGVAGAMGVWSLVVGPALDRYEGSTVAALLVSAYPVGDVLLLFGVVSVVLRRPVRRVRRALLVLVVGMVALAVGDLAFAHSVLVGSESTTALSDASWLVALGAFAVAGHVARWHRAEADEVPPEVWAPLPASRLPYVAVVLAYAFALHAEPVRDAQGAALFVGVGVITLLVAFRQASVQELNAQLAAELDRLATTDVLTGLPNRRAFFEQGAERLRRAERDRSPAAVLMIDLDRFKAINDTYGHAVGDEVLQCAAGRVRDALRADDLVARIGGDEFAVVLGDADTELATLAVRRVHDAVTCTAAPTEAGPIPLGLSVGVGAHRPGELLDELLARADASLYAAKRAKARRDLRALERAAGADA